MLGSILVGLATIYMVVIVIGAIIKTTQKISRVGFAKWRAGISGTASADEPLTCLVRRLT
jgi:hypothetical protein